ncbi:hypothetical protein H4N58_18055 [Mumia sp. ZJ1417]|nr:MULTISPECIES: hypothetical protein [unclassified Mumia]QMW66024.1 hypothetical protein H4N58_18055 [Mumia sp. ZJ1417]
MAMLAALVAGVALAAVASLTTSLGTIGASGSHAQAAGAPAPTTPERSVETMLHALGEGDVGAACSVAAPDGFPIRTGTALQRCEDGLGRLLDDLEPRELSAYREVVVRGALVEGDGATVEPRHLAHAPVAMHNAVFVLVRAGGAWFVVV